ncbi:MAG: DUF3990 domain-containing protein [Muribaculaceae bacterium]|nr:DUF3990 domain-containing protein [Muribaculaceae bacterium]
MRLYHGSYCKIKLIDLNFSRKYMDFGPGFYLTPNYRRAVMMANRSVDLRGEGMPEVNSFIFNRISCSKCVKIKEFKSNNWEWAEFVMKNRDKSAIVLYNHEYDIVIGPVADSRVDAEIRNYKQEAGENYLNPVNLKTLASRLRYAGESYIQYCFCTERSLNYLIRD